MVQMITDHVTFLAEAKRAVEELASYRESEYNLSLEEKRLERALEAEKKAVSDSISLTVKKRTEQINASYDQEISRGQDRLKKVRAKREKAKNQGVKERILEETQELRDDNKELSIRMKTLFQQNHVPHFCNSKWYYSLYFTKGLSEILVFILTLLISFLAVPYLIYILLPEQKPLYMVGIYFITVLVFGGLYVTISNNTKVRYLVALKEGRSIRNVMISNQKKIRVITSTIRKDKNETIYDLEKYDDEIARVELELAEIMGKKKEALNAFETVTKTIIADEIAGNSKERLEHIQSEHGRTARDLVTVTAQIKEKSLYIADNYEIYLERDFLLPDKIAALSGLMETGEAKNLTDAIAILKSR